MARKKIKLEEEAITEILVADTNSESSPEAGDVDDFEEEEEDDDDNNNKSLQKSNHRLQVLDYQLGDCLKEGTQMFIHLSVQQKV